jgi:penicillin amidase
MMNSSNSAGSASRTVAPPEQNRPAESSPRAAADSDDRGRAQTAPKPRRRRWLRALGWLVAVILLVVCGATVWFYEMARGSLPQVDGQISVAGLAAQTTVIRDARGVPHIVAGNAEDLFFAQGYVTAQDRLWQMDFSRRLADGSAAEVLGAALLNHDKEQRILGIRQVAERSWQAVPERDRKHFEAYARGVNAYIESHHDRLPIEFRVLRYSPARWTAVDSLLCGILMSEGLNHGLFDTKLMREKFVDRLGPDFAADLFPNSSRRDHAPGVDQNVDAPNRVSSVPTDAPRSAARFVSAEEPTVPPVPDDALVPGSNNWVVSGAHTATGRPLLSNDMHLGLRIPNTWYEAQLEIRPAQGGAGFDVVGFTLPGLPYVLVGHNQRIAWGFTNLVPDVEDVFVETVRPDGEYQTPGGWKPMEKRREVIHVKGKPDVIEDVKITRHGPVITELELNEKRTLALRWSIYDEPVAVPFFDINAAQNWQEFRAALSHFSGPAQNIVYADVDGHIGYQAAGHIPIRRSGDGSLPVSGADNQHEWTGYIPFDRMPVIYDPASGVIATANNRVTPDRYPYGISTQWGSPYRTERIYHVLNSTQKLTAEDMLRLQTDTYSVFDRFCAERFAAAVSRSSRASARARQAAELMRGWNGWVSPDMPAPTLIAQSRRELLHLLLAQKLQTAVGKTAEGDTDWPWRIF